MASPVPVFLIVTVQVTVAEPLTRLTTAGLTVLVISIFGAGAKFLYRICFPISSPLMVATATMRDAAVESGEKSVTQVNPSTKGAPIPLRL